MTFQPSSLRVAGQDEDFVDFIFSSSETLWCPPLSLGPEKLMYGNNDSIKSWIDAIDRANKPTFDPYDSKKTNVFEFASHPFRTCLPRSPLDDDFDSDSEISFCFAASAWAPDLFASCYYDESDESHSDSSLSDDAQYVTIPSDSPWYRRPLPSPSPSPKPFSAHELNTAAFAPSCSSDLRQAIAQQELLLAVFHEELRRIVPRGDSTAYDVDWMEDMDADLVLAPLESYADLCWETAVCEKPPSRPTRPAPDVPIGFDDVYASYF